MTTRIRQSLLLIPMALAANGLITGNVQAAGSIPAGLDIRHAAPSNGKVSALLIGKSFVPQERIHVTYKVTVRNVSQRTYQFDTRTDKFGAFFKKLRFDLGNRRYGYILKVTAVGERGDRATLNTWAYGQG